MSTGTSVASRFAPDDELEPEATRESPVPVELSRADPTRGSVVSIAVTQLVSSWRSAHFSALFPVTQGHDAAQLRQDVEA